MSVRFDPTARLVLVQAVVRGPLGDISCRLAVDTAASGTQINHHTLRLAGYDVTTRLDPVQVYTAGGAVHAHRLSVEGLTCLGLSRTPFRVVCHTVTTTTRVDGLLGLDFLRGHVLTLDMARGRLDLRPPRPWWRFWR